eukprot:10470442-Alexandrium_andersonii.AAC.1
MVVHSWDRYGKRCVQGGPDLKPSQARRGTKYTSWSVAFESVCYVQVRAAVCDVACVCCLSRCLAMHAAPYDVWPGVVCMPAHAIAQVRNACVCRGMRFAHH